MESGDGVPFTESTTTETASNDESIIPAIIIDVIPKTASVSSTPKKGAMSTFMKKDPTTDNVKGLTKVVYMPRNVYLKHFARGLKGEYTGSEPYRRWSEEELEEQFGKYKSKETGYRVPQDL